MQYKVWLKACVATFREMILGIIMALQTVSADMCATGGRTNWLQKAWVLQHIFKTIYSQSWALHEPVWLKKTLNFKRLLEGWQLVLKRCKQKQPTVSFGSNLENS